MSGLWVVLMGLPSRLPVVLPFGSKRPEVERRGALWAFGPGRGPPHPAPRRACDRSRRWSPARRPPVRVRVGARVRRPSLGPKKRPDASIPAHSCTTCTTPLVALLSFANLLNATAVPTDGDRESVHINRGQQPREGENRGASHQLKRPTEVSKHGRRAVPPSGGLPLTFAGGV